jgi:hypothetical protein
MACRFIATRRRFNHRADERLGETPALTVRVGSAGRVVPIRSHRRRGPFRRRPPPPFIAVAAAGPRRPAARILAPKPFFLATSLTLVDNRN